MSDNSIKIKNGKINFSCRMHLCKQSCCGPFAGISEELSNVDKRPFDEIVLTPADYKRIYDNGYVNLIEEDISEQTGKRYYKMALASDGTCLALKNGLCSVNSIKPTLCKAFPFYIDMFSGLCAIKCDGFSDDYWTETENCRYALDAAREMYEFWIDFYLSDKDSFISPSKDGE